MRKQVFRAILLLASILVPGLQAEEDGVWPRFRGPNGQGAAGRQGLPVKWEAGDSLWKTDLDGEGHSSPVVWSKRVFVTAAKKNDCQLLCLDADSGEVLWRRSWILPEYRMNSLNHYAASTPAADADRVYVVWSSAEKMLVAALSHEGEPVWERDFGPTYLRHGPCSSPIVLDGKVIFTHEQRENDKGLVSQWLALDAGSGETVWRIERENCDSPSYSTPCLYESDGRRELIFTSLAHGFTGVDPASGEVLWEVPGVFPQRVVASPLIAGDTILNACGAGSAGKSLVAVRIPKSRDQRPVLAYTIEERFTPYVPTPVAAEGLAFLFHDTGTVTCIRAATGEMVWSEKPGGRFFGSPILADGRIYAINRDGEVVVLAASDQYERLAVNPLGEASQATPAAAGGRLYLRTLSQLICIEDGEQ